MGGGGPDGRCQLANVWWVHSVMGSEGGTRTDPSHSADIGMQLNTAMFARAGRSGYVLKPALLRKKGGEKDKEALIRVASFVLDIEVSRRFFFPSPYYRLTMSMIDHIRSAAS